MIKCIVTTFLIWWENDEYSCKVKDNIVCKFSDEKEFKSFKKKLKIFENNFGAIQYNYETETFRLGLFQDEKFFKRLLKKLPNPYKEVNWDSYGHINIVISKYEDCKL